MKTQHFAVIALAIQAMSVYSERVGRTRIQKFLFLAEHWLQGMPRHTFEMYRYGPYSFDLDGEMQALRSVGVIQGVANPDGYGMSYSVEEAQVNLARNKGGIPPSTQKRFDDLGRWIGQKRVRQLEAIGTAEFITRERTSPSDEEVILRVLTIKPHLERNEVQEAVKELNEMRAKLQGGAPPQPSEAAR